MSTVNMHEAKSKLSRLVEQLESGVEKEIIIARNGKPAARLVPLRKARPAQRIGVARGKFTAPDDLDEADEEILELFTGQGG